MERVWTNFLNTSEKDYYLEKDRIITMEKSFGDVIVDIVFESQDENAVRKLWNHMAFMFNAGKREKIKQIKQALEI